MAKFIVLTGMKFGRLVVISQAERPLHITTREKFWLCQCECGNKKIIAGDSLRNGDTKSCGCFKSEMMKDRAKKMAEGNRIPDSSFSAIYKGYIRTAKSKNLPFEIIKDDFKRLTKENCFYCGIEPKSIMKGSFSEPYVYNGLDRIDSNIGYTLENVVPCCTNCNYAKHTMTTEEFYKWIYKVYIFNREKILELIEGNTIDKTQPI